MKAIEIQLQTCTERAQRPLQAYDDEFLGSLLAQVSDAGNCLDDILVPLDNPDALAVLLASRTLGKVSRETIVTNAVRHLQGMVEPHETISSAELGMMARKSTLMAMASEMCREAESQRMRTSTESRFGDLHRVRMSSVHVSTTAVSNLQVNFDVQTDVEVEAEVIAVVGFVVVAFAVLDAAPKSVLIQSRDIIAAADRYLTDGNVVDDMPLERMMPVSAVDIRILAKRILSNYKGESMHVTGLAREEAA
ncbi:hypothetical protein [Xanthomonas oryzae]|uniref:hypothetical protein n=1 Tax=Xanthomonas oryzae TaxID=347 RepID=UPI00059B00FE|nr:hypothetical protein [Xanthomonas oryzae]AXM41551.1 hypothetical protein BRN51_22645 [Xanthomonas oryzae pv. oryzae]RBF79971.1 hypothetical protein BRM95_25100 [Xanthomonas oryzae pv. oryzae]RBK65380.1 hypothetical protein BRN49_10105 [Xanthomonas oryzae pv. oryzae]UEQ19646.1 hypothetical protein KFK26_21420 [Xanthomonas oryzae]